MKKRNTKQVELEEVHHHFDCQCYMPSHSLRISYLADYEDPRMCEMTISTQLHHNAGFFGRLWNCFKYIFKIDCPNDHWDDYFMKHEDVDRMLKILQNYKKDMIRLERNSKKRKNNKS